MNIALSFPGLILFLAAAAAELFWLAPTTESVREKKIAGAVGWGLLLSGCVLYAVGRWMQ